MKIAGYRIQGWRVYAALVALSAISQWLLWPGFGSPSTYGPQRVVRITGHEGQPLAIAYHEYGDAHAAKTIIALHGSPTMGEDFKRLGPLLGRHFRVLAPLMPGYGRSTPWVDDYGIAACADDVRGFMDAMGVKRAHVIGYSFGSAVAIALTDELPRRVESLTLASGLGVQEHEGTGDYDFEHLKYDVGYAVFVAGPELLPHFGLLGDRSVRHAFIRNFTDSDQRPIRAMLERLNDADRDVPGVPVLILHGRNDPLVPVAAAREHHDIVRRSRLVTFSGGHILLFTAKGAKQYADQIVPFIEQVNNQSAGTFARSTVDQKKQLGGMEGKLFRRLRLEERANPWWRLAAVAAATFVSEDLTCISVGLLVNAGRIDLFLGVFGCFAGIFVGDVGLWLLGRVLGRRVLEWKPIARRLPTRRVEGLTQWFDRYGFVAVFASRFMPGTRLPLYVSAGVIGTKSKKFLIWALFAAMFYTPIIVLVVAVAGDVVAGPMQRFFGGGWLALLVTALVILLAIRLVTALGTPTGRYRMWARLQRIWRWEFWPGWVFYLPLVPVFAWLALRFRGFGVFTAADPVYEDGGIVGESKWKILSRLQDEPIAPSRLLKPDEMLDTLTWPQIFKPDAGQRGAGVKKIESIEQADAYLAKCGYAVLAQTYHPGPHEAGIFYYRMPGEERGRIFSITDKVFSVIEGDGKHTLAQLIWKHPRYRMQAAIFLKRLGEQRSMVLAKGERKPLALAGNHCQGTMFVDGETLKTEALEREIDRIAHKIDGFYFGRFDVRYADADELRAGRGFTIIEVNAVSSESTNLYDPHKSLCDAYGILTKQWGLAFAIGAANRARGHPPMSGLRILRRLWRYYRTRRVDLLAD